MANAVVAVLSAVILGAVTAVPAPAYGESPPRWQQEARFTSAPVVERPDRVVVLKSARRMMLMQDYRILRVYTIALGRHPEGHKQREGDSRTPEGRYVLDYRLEESLFHRAIRISYPDEQDRAHAAAAGVDPGGRIMIHGLPENWTAEQIGHPQFDWTQGCIAVTNEEMDEIWNLVEAGTPIDIHP